MLLMKKVLKIFLVLVVLSIIAVYLWRYVGKEDSGRFELYGNVDQRQVELAFIDSERIEKILIEEGDVVQQGQVLATQETRRLRDQIKILESEVKVSEVALTRLKNGSRPEDVAKARALADAALAEAEYTGRQYERYENLWKEGKQAISRKDVDEKETQHLIAKKILVHSEKSLALAELGPRQEDIDEAEETLALNRNRLNELNNRLLDAELKAPDRGVVRRRLMEPGDMALPQRAVFSLSVISPKWVRAYVSEKDLGLIKPGMKAVVYTDSNPDVGIGGNLGFISSIAEFTPKTVQTPDLRTSLVYEIRIYVNDEDDILRLGMPVTVVFPDLERKK